MPIKCNLGGVPIDTQIKEGSQNPVRNDAVAVALAALGAGAKIETGSYKGTGKSGVDGKNRLEFSFTPAVVFVYLKGELAPSANYYYGRANGYGTSFAFFAVGAESLYTTDGSSYGVTKYTLSQILTWYNSVDDTQQLNDSGKTYKYIAIG